MGLLFDNLFCALVSLQFYVSDFFKKRENKVKILVTSELWPLTDWCHLFISPSGHWPRCGGQRRGPLPPPHPQQPVPHKQFRGHQHSGRAGPRGQRSLSAAGGGFGRSHGPTAHHPAAPCHRSRRGWQQSGVLSAGLRSHARREQPRWYSHPPAQREWEPWCLNFDLFTFNSSPNL